MKGNNKMLKKLAVIVFALTFTVQAAMPMQVLAVENESADVIAYETEESYVEDEDSSIELLHETEVLGEVDESLDVEILDETELVDDAEPGQEEHDGVESEEEVVVSTFSAVTQSEYDYEIHILNPLRMYSRQNLVVFVRTNNPDPSTISIGTAGGVGSYVDLTTTEVPGVWVWGAVSGGYVISKTIQHAGDNTLELRENPEGFDTWQDVRNSSVVATLDFVAGDSNVAFENMIEEIIEDSVTPGMSLIEQVQAVASHILRNFVYPLNNYGYLAEGETDWRLISRLASDAPVWHSKEVDSWSAPSLFCTVALRLGVDEATWRNPGMHYEISRVIIDGEVYHFSVTNYATSNNFDPAMIPAFDLSRFDNGTIGADRNNAIEADVNDDANGNTNADANGNTNADSNGNANADANANANVNTDINTNTNTTGGKTNNNNHQVAPKTGDVAHTQLLSSMMISSIVVIFTTLIKISKKK